MRLQSSDASDRDQSLESMEAQSPTIYLPLGRKCNTTLHENRVFQVCTSDCGSICTSCPSPIAQEREKRIFSHIKHGRCYASGARNTLSILIPVITSSPIQIMASSTRIAASLLLCATRAPHMRAATLSRARVAAPVSVQRPQWKRFGGYGVRTFGTERGNKVYQFEDVCCSSLVSKVFGRS